MSKPFNIHDWQAKQRQQLLKENFANQKYYDLLNDLRDEGHLHRYGVTQLQMQFSLSEEEAQKIYNQYKEDLKAEQPDAYDFYMKDLNEASEVGPTIADQIFELFDHKIGEWTISPDYRVTQETQKYLEAWKEEAKSRINLILGDVNEASMTGTGASITTGDSMAYATPNAFKKKNKKD